MDSRQDMSGNDTENAETVMESVGEPTETADQVNESHETVGHENRGDPLYVQKRLKQQKRAHDREMREMQARMDHMQSQFSQQTSGYQNQQNPHDQAPVASGMDDAIHKAVSFALQQREMEERKAQEAAQQQHIARQYGELSRHLDQTADKYEDFDEVVRGEAPFTAHMRDAALLLPRKGPGSAGEVLYRLGQNPEELARIAKLPSIDQAAEMVALSHALISGGEQKHSSPRPLGQVKANPVVNSAGVTEKTPVSDIRARMRKGTFK